MTITYVRYNPNVAFEPRVFGPKPSDHPSCHQICPACGGAFEPGDYTTLIPLGPGDDEEARESHAQGRWYSAVAIEVHAACAGIPVPSEG